jgi:hypothetical protein
MTKTMSKNKRRKIKRKAEVDILLGKVGASEELRRSLLKKANKDNAWLISRILTAFNSATKSGGVGSDTDTIEQFVKAHW